VKEKDIIKSDDCVLLRPENAEKNGITPYLAKVKWFWKEPESGTKKKPNNLFFFIKKKIFILKVKFKCHLFGIIILNIVNYHYVLKNIFYPMKC
jgi:hypothetical protein